MNPKMILKFLKEELMRKLLITLLATGSVSAFAADNGFQQFDNQYNVGYGVNQMSTGAASVSGDLVGNEYINLEVEKLFDNNIWFDVNANLVTYTTNFGANSKSADPVASGGGLLSANGNFGGINAKVGYAFPLISNALQLTPYVQAGRNTNLSGYSVGNSMGYGTANATNVTNDFYYTTGAGARLEYRALDNVSVYFDQSAVYNFDQTPYTAGFGAQNTFQARSTLGVKYNAYKSLQIGLQGYYDAYNNGNSAGTGNSSSATSFATAQAVQMPISNIGGLISVGLTY